MSARNATLKSIIIAIDGPSGAGKSTVSRQLADALGGKLLDTGAMYRGVAYWGLKRGAKTSSDFVRVARSLKFSAHRESGTLLINGEELGTRLRTERVSQMASTISRYRGVREILTRRQRTLGRELSRRMPVVVEGRDIGTVVFPKVHFKFYVTADPKVRAHRRYQQLKRQGATGITLKSILRQNEERDTRDSTRELAPLRCPDDAVVVDTSSMGISQVVKFLSDHVRIHTTLPNLAPPARIAKGRGSSGT